MAYLPPPPYHQQYPQNQGYSEHLALPTSYAQQHQVSPVLPVNSHCYRFHVDSSTTRRGSDNNSNSGNNGNNGNGHGHGQGQGQPFPLILQLNQPPPPPAVNRVPKPWWIWTIACYEFVEVFFVAGAMIYWVANDGVAANADREKLMFLFFATLVTLLIQLSGGLALFYGLFTTQERTTLSCFQGWIYGTYFLLFEKTIVLLNNILKYGTSPNPRGVMEPEGSDDPPEVTLPPLRDTGLDDNDNVAVEKLAIILGKTLALTIRLLAVLTMRRFVRNMEARLIYGIAEGEQHRRVGEIPPPPPQLQDPNGNASPSQGQGQPQAQAPTPGFGAAPGEGVLPLQDENLYYAPQLSHVMTMMLS